MENVTEALYMATAVLVFMLALSLTLSSFSSFRNDLDRLITAEERVDEATITDSSGKTSYINYISSDSELRTVGIETVVNSLYRVYKENYMVVMKLKESNDYTKFDSTGELKDFSNLKKSGSDNVENQIYYKNGNKIDLINGNNDSLLVFNIPSAQNDPDYISKALDAGLYNLLKGKTFTEYTGIYYETDTISELNATNWDAYKDQPSNVSDVNKREARVITYIEN